MVDANSDFKWKEDVIALFGNVHRAFFAQCLNSHRRRTKRIHYIHLYYQTMCCSSQSTNGRDAPVFGQKHLTSSLSLSGQTYRVHRHSPGGNRRLTSSMMTLSCDAIASSSIVDSMLFPGSKHVRSYSL